MLLLAVSLALPAANVRERALAIEDGAAIQLRLRSGEKLAMRLVRVEERGIRVRELMGQAPAERLVLFNEIRGLKRAGEGIHPGWVVLMTLGGLYGILGAIAASR